MFYTIGRARAIVKKLKEGDDHKLAIFATLVVFKEKLEIGYRLIKSLWGLIQKCRAKNDNQDQGDVKEENKPKEEKKEDKREEKKEREHEQVNTP